MTATATGCASRRARALWPGVVLVSMMLGGCLTAPRAVLATPSGEVRASDETTAREVAEYARWAEREVRARLPGLRTGGVDIWVQAQVSAGLWSRIHMRTGEYSAFTLSSPDLPRPRIHVPSDGYRDTLSHEYVHALLGAQWDSLPAILEEGLCTIVSIEITEAIAEPPEYLLLASLGPQFVRAHKVEPEQLELRSLLKLTQSLELDDHGVEYQKFAYGMGYFLVRRIVERAGIEGLFELCLCANAEQLDLIPADRILAAAELPPGVDLTAAVNEEFDGALFDYFVQLDEFRQLLADRPAGVAVEDVLVTYSHPWLEDGDIDRLFHEMPGFEAWAAEHPELLEPEP